MANGCANETRVVVEEVEAMALVDAGSQVSTLTEGFCAEFGLRVLPPGVLLYLEGTGGIVVLYKGYID